MNPIRTFHFSCSRKNAVRVAAIVVVALISGHVYFTVSFISLSFRAQNEWRQIEAVVESRNNLEQAYAKKLDEMRTSDGAAFGLIGPNTVHYLEPFSSVARAGL